MFGVGFFLVLLFSKYCDTCICNKVESVTITEEIGGGILCLMRRYKYKFDSHADWKPGKQQYCSQLRVTVSSVLVRTEVLHQYSSGWYWCKNTEIMEAFATCLCYTKGLIVIGSRVLFRWIIPSKIFTEQEGLQGWWSTTILLAVLRRSDLTLSSKFSPWSLGGGKRLLRPWPRRQGSKQSC